MGKIALIVFFMSTLICFVGCESPVMQALFQEQEWSDNYALEEGVTCTAMEMIDGDIETVGKPAFPEGVYGRTVVGAFPKAEAEIVLPEKKSIRKIVIRSEQLESFDIYASAGENDWKLIKEFENNSEKEIVIRTSVITDKIKIRARGISSHGGLDRGQRGNIVRTSSISEPEIQEIELYGFR